MRVKSVMQASMYEIFAAHELAKELKIILGDVGSISCKSIPEIGGCNSDQQNFRVFPDEN